LGSAEQSLCCLQIFLNGHLNLLKQAPRVGSCELCRRAHPVFPARLATPLIDAETLPLARYGIVTAAENTVTTVMQAALSPFAADVGDGGIFLGVN
jgi:hypothetical protein